LIGTIFAIGFIDPVKASEGNKKNSSGEKIIVGGDFDYKPFTYLDENGQARGFDVDIIKAIAHQYNRDLEFRFTPWDQALKNLQQGKVDVLLSVLYTEQRDTMYDYTIPYNEDYYGIFVREHSDIDEISDLSEKQIITLKGDASVTSFIKPMAFLKNTTLVESLPEAIQLLSEGEGDAVLAPYSIGMEAVEDLRVENVQVEGPPVMPILYRFAVKKGDSQLLSLLNDGIDQVKVTGEREQLIEKWNFHKRNEVSLEKVIRYVEIGLIPILLTIALLILWTKSLRRTVAKKTRVLQEKTERLEELNATRDKLFSVIAHDLKSPFNSILGLSELLMNDMAHNDTSRSDKLLRYIHSSAKNTLILTENLLNWAKSQTGQMQFEPEPVQLKEVVDEVTGIVDASAKYKNVDVGCESMPNIKMYADRNMLKSVLYNLITNAIKFSHENGTVEISAHARRDFVQVTVSDQGVGMDEETKQKLFQIDSGSAKGTANEEGSGLGLILCKEFVEKQGGQIWVDSALGAGSRFYFTIPASI
jgi:signal transduction histidine kinase